MSNEYECCTHNPDVPSYLRCPDVSSKRPEVNVYLDVTTLEQEIEELKDSQSKQDEAIEEASAAISSLEKAVSDMEEDQREQNESLYKHGDRLADLEDVVKHKVLPYIGEDDDRDDTQESRISDLEVSAEDQKKRIAELLESASEAEVRGSERDRRLDDLERDLSNHMKAASDDRDQLVSDLSEQFSLVEQAINKNSDDIDALRSDSETVHSTQGAITKTITVKGEEKVVVPFSALFYTNDSSGEPVMFQSSWNQYQKMVSDNRSLIIDLQSKVSSVRTNTARIDVLEAASVDTSANFEDIQTVMNGYESRIADLEAKMANLEALIAVNS